MATTSMIHVRVEEQIKKEATQALEAMGLSVSDAVRVFLTRIAAEKRIPFALRVPNAETREAMEEARTVERARFASAAALFDDLEKDTRP